jgi:hypothetical protein
MPSARAAFRHGLRAAELVDARAAAAYLWRGAYHDCAAVRGPASEGPGTFSHSGAVAPLGTEGDLNNLDVEA